MTSNGAPNGITLLKNNGDGSFSARGTYLAGVNPIDVKVTDMNQDGEPDLVVTNRGTLDAGGSASVLFGLGNMTFSSDGSVGYQFRLENDVVTPVSMSH